MWAKLEPILCWVLLVALLGWMSYVTFIKPHTNPEPTTSQEAKQIVNHNPEVRSTFGCYNVRVMEYYGNKEIK